MERKELIEKISEIGNIDRDKNPLIIIGIIKFYPKSDIHLYKDAIIIDTPNAFISFNANLGENVGQGIYYAHRIIGNELVQTGEILELSNVHINKGDYHSTVLSGHQKVYPSQYEAFISVVKSEAKRLFTPQGYDKVNIPYVLIDIKQEVETIPI